MDCIYDRKCNKKACGELFCRRKYKLDYLYDAAKLSDKQRIRVPLYPDDVDLEKFKLLSEIEQNIVDFVSSGSNLFIHSKYTGNGKTSWAVRLIQAYIEKTWAKSSLECHALFISVPTFLQALKSGFTETNEYAEYIKKNIFTADLVVWDEMGNKVASEYDMDVLLSYIDSRINAGKSNIYTANKNVNELSNLIGVRLASRVGRSNVIDIEFETVDKRKV